MAGPPLRGRQAPGGTECSHRGRLRLKLVTYLDHAATTPVRPEASRRCSPGSRRSATPRPCMRRDAAPAAPWRSRGSRWPQRWAPSPSDVVFTGGGTESDNLALKGLYWARHAADPRRRRVLVSAVEHHAVLDAAEWLARCQGAEVVHLPVDGAGRVEPEAFRAAVRGRARHGGRGQRDVGEQRGRHRAARRRACGGRRPSSGYRCTPTPCRRSGRCRSRSPPPARRP